MTKLNKSDEGNKGRGPERWEYPPGRGRIIPASQQRPVCAEQKAQGASAQLGRYTSFHHLMGVTHYVRS